MNCHKCPVTAEIAKGTYADTPFDDTPCASCRFNPNSGNPIEYDDNRQSFNPDQPVSPQEMFYQLTQPERSLARNGPELNTPLSVLTLILTTILALPDATRDALIMRYHGAKYRDIAKAQGTTTARAEQRVKHAIAKAPILAPLLPTDTPRRRAYATVRNKTLSPPKRALTEPKPVACTPLPIATPPSESE